MSQLEVGLLGRFEASLDGKPAKGFDSDKVIRNYMAHAGPLTHVSISPDGETAMSSAFDGTVRIWRIDPEPEDLMQWAMENRYVRV